MQFPESWLREFCDPPIGSIELAERLTMAGLEVESLRPVAPPFHGVVVGRVVAVEKHPDADRLRVCMVDVGAGEHLSIVCGAPNVEAGIRVPCARVGAELPPVEAGGEPFRIKVGKIRGVESRGMLCSARELKLSDDHGGLLVLDAGATVGEDIRKTLRLDDTLFTLKLTPNLGHALSVFGVARELAAITGAPLKTPAYPAVVATDDSRLPVTIAAPDLCGRFSGRVVRNVGSCALSTGLTLSIGSTAIVRTPVSALRPRDIVRYPNASAPITAAAMPAMTSVRPLHGTLAAVVGANPPLGVTMSSSARTISPAFCGRSDARFSRQRITSVASAGGTPGLRRSIGSALSIVCAASIAAAGRPLNGVLPVSSS